MKSTALPKSFADWLARKPTPKKRTRLKPMSKRREGEARLYSKKRKAFLAARPYCEAWDIIVDWAADNSPHVFMVAPEHCPRSQEIHHRCKRGKNYLNESTWLAVCRWSHEFIENNKRIARLIGLLQ